MYKRLDIPIHLNVLFDTIIPQHLKASRSPQPSTQQPRSSNIINTLQKPPICASRVLSVFTTVLAASSAVAQLSPNTVVDAIKKITDLSEDTANIANDITNPTNAITNGLVRSPSPSIVVASC